jgi:hypothetical protein
MALPNEGAEMMMTGAVPESAVEVAEDNDFAEVPELITAGEAFGDPALTVEQMNELFDKHVAAMRSDPQFRKGDIVQNSPMANELGDLTPLAAEQKALVMVYGQDVTKMTQDSFVNTIINFVDTDGELQRACISSRFLEKTGHVVTENQKGKK